MVIEGAGGTDFAAKLSIFQLCEMVDQAANFEPGGQRADISFCKLLQLRRPLREAATYIYVNDLDALAKLDHQRELAVAKAFQAAQLPRDIVAFRHKAIEHGMQRELPMINNLQRRMVTLGSRFRGFAIVYAEANNSLDVDVHRRGLITHTPIISFSAALSQDGEYSCYTLNKANPDLIGRSNDLQVAMRKKANLADEARQRKTTLGQMQQRSY